MPGPSQCAHSAAPCPASLTQVAPTLQYSSLHCHRTPATRIPSQHLAMSSWHILHPKCRTDIILTPCRTEMALQTTPSQSQALLCLCNTLCRVAHAGHRQRFGGHAAPAACHLVLQGLSLALRHPLPERRQGRPMASAWSLLTRLLMIHGSCPEEWHPAGHASVPHATSSSAHMCMLYKTGHAPCSVVWPHLML